MQLLKHFLHSLDLSLLLAKLTILVALVDAVRDRSAVVEAVAVAVQTAVRQSRRSEVLVQQLVGHLTKVLHVADHHRSQMQEIRMIGIHDVERTPGVIATERCLAVHLFENEEISRMVVS